MATVRSGERSVLLVVDAQVGVLEGAWEAARAVEAMALAVRRAREARAPVIWVRHEDEELVPGTAGWRIVPDLRPAANEAIVAKRFQSSFEGTDLEERLAALGATRIVLAGAATNWCVRAAAYAALERGYDLTLLGDAHTAPDLPLEDGRQVEAAGVVRDLNAVMTWLRYPGRTCGTATAAEVGF